VADVVLVEDNTVDRRLIHTFFHQNFDPSRWREFSTGRTALDACRERVPNLLLVDVYLPDMDGLEIARRLRQDGHVFPIVVLTFLPQSSQLQPLLDLNVLGYLDKSQLCSCLPAAVNSVLDGRMFFSAHRAPSVPEPNDPSTPTTGLSPREVEIARLVVHGLPSKQIAGRLGLSARTVENHRARIMTRLDLANVADLVRWCMDHGIT
jgi:two-component system, NarL family, response regulator NreC